MMDEKRKEEIRLEAKKILDNFGKTLESVKFKQKEVKVELSGFREEGSGNENVGDRDFRERMFENAPNKDKDSIIAEKKKW